MDSDTEQYKKAMDKMSKVEPFSSKYPDTPEYEKLWEGALYGKEENIIWIVATDLGAQSNIGEFVDAIKKNNGDVHEVSLEEMLTPSYIPQVDKNRKVIFYGSVNFINWMADLDFSPGVFGDNQSYSYSNLCKNIPHGMIFNSPADSGTVHGNASDILSALESKDEDELFFFKPGDDSKFIAGQVSTVSDIRKKCNQLINNQIPDADGNNPLLLSIPYGIEAEYRLFVVNGNIITGSKYYPNQDPEVPEAVIEYGKEVIKHWNPEPLFVLDVVISNSNYFVMEIQNFHSAGHYMADKMKLIKAVHRYLNN